MTENAPWYSDRSLELERLIRTRYEQKLPGRADWADWLYANHIFVVGAHAGRIAHRHGSAGDGELAWAGGVLHDIADVEMRRDDARHGLRSAELAEHLLGSAGYASAERSRIADAVASHNGRGPIPADVVARAVAAGDAVAHLCTDFYLFASRSLPADWTLDAVKAWASGKIERDFEAKITFDDVRCEVRTAYSALRIVFAPNL